MHGNLVRRLIKDVQLQSSVNSQWYKSILLPVGANQGVAMYVSLGIDCTVIFEKSVVATSR